MVPTSVWDKLSRVVIFLLFLAGLTAVFFWYLPLIQQNQRYRKRIFELDAKIHEQEKHSRHLRASIESLQNDPSQPTQMKSNPCNLPKWSELHTSLLVASLSAVGLGRREERSETENA